MTQGQTMMLAHLDPEADRLLTRLSALVTEFSIEDVWTVLDPENTVSVSSREFLDRAKELGFYKKEARYDVEEPFVNIWSRGRRASEFTRAK